MIKKIENYLDDLKKELKGSDPALIQDALSDAEEHLHNALKDRLAQNKNSSEKDALLTIIEEYGTPEETASAYKKIELRTKPSLSMPRKRETGTLLQKFFSVLAEPHAWGAFLYMVVSFLTGCIFGGWTFLGSIVSSISLLLVFTLPISGLFLLSLRGIALIEGRIIEATLGTRMPRKPLFVKHNLNSMEKFKTLFRESHTWKILIYFLLQLPLGILYSLLALGLFAFSLSFIFSPILELVFQLPLELFGTEAFTPVWLLPIVSISGIILLTSIFHLAKFLGKHHGKYAKFMLVHK
jgi:uncharacterized membrane protein